MINRLPALIGKKQQEDNRVISVAQLAEDTGVSRETIYKWISGEANRFDGKVIEAFCRYFNCNVGDLLTMADSIADSQSLPTNS